MSALQTTIYNYNKNKKYRMLWQQAFINRKLKKNQTTTQTKEGIDIKVTTVRYYNVCSKNHERTAIYFLLATPWMGTSLRPTHKCKMSGGST